MLHTVRNHALHIYNHHFFRYLFVGGSTFTIDLALLVFLHGILHANLIVSASLSYWVSIVYNFIMNRFWTFGASENARLVRHMLLYGILLFFNYLFTVVFIEVAGHFGMHYAIAKVLAVIIQTSWTYYIYREIIFTV